MITPVASVIVPAFKTADLIGETLSSIASQTFSDFEVLIIDDGSPDDIAGAVSPFLADPRFRLLQFPNGGLATARNRGIEQATGEFVVFIDSDDRLMPTYLEEMTAALAADEDVAFVCADARMFGTPSREGRLYSEFEPVRGQPTLASVLDRSFNVPVAVTARRSDLVAMGGFDASLRSAEDFDLWIRLLAAGRRGICLPKPLWEYRRRQRSLSADAVWMSEWTAAVYARAARLLQGTPYEQLSRELERQCLDRAMIGRARRHFIEGNASEARRLLGATVPASLPRFWRFTRLLSYISPSLAQRLITWNDRRYALG